MSIGQICQDESLVGHFLFSLPDKLWAFSTGEFCLYEHPNPATLNVKWDYGIARAIRYHQMEPDVLTITERIEFCIERPLCDTVEFIGRRVFGLFAAAVSIVSAYPIGFVTKVLHFHAREMSNYVASSTLGQKIGQIWDDECLFGHVLTSAPLACYTFATTPLEWHLRPDGSDRRNFRAIISSGTVTQFESEYELVPFELFETIWRRVFGGALTLAAGIISPIGLVAKVIDLATRPVIFN